MNGNYEEVLSAFFDGEAVDPDRLAASLQEPDAINALVEFARLRRAVYADTSRPGEQLCESMRDTLASADRRHRVRRRLVQLSLAASLVLAAGLGGFGLNALLTRHQGPPSFAGAGHVASQAPAARSAPPVTAPVSAPAGSSTQGAKVPLASRPAVPSPDLRMRFPDWSDKVL